jgi:PAS domain S-box-containing protein
VRISKRLEDEFEFPLKTSVILKEHGFSVIPCGRGDEAVRKIDSGTEFHLALIDIDPGSDCGGVEAARLIQADYDIPIVFLTSYPDRKSSDTLNSLTGYGYVRKNTDDFVLIESLEMAFRLFEAHQKIKESEAKYRAAFMTSPDSININQLEDGEYVDINEGFTALSGYTSEEVVGKTSTELCMWAYPEDRKKLVEGLNRKGIVENLEAEFRCKDGSLKTGLMSARSILMENKPHIISITRDISGKKKIEQELIMSERRMRSLFDQAADGILIGSGTGLITDANISICRITGYLREELIGSPIDIIFPRPQLDEKPLRYDLVHKGEIVQKERLIQTKDGRLVPVIMIKKVDDDCLQANIHDISGIRKAEEALQESEERFRLAAEGSRDGLWDWNLQTDEAYNSEQFARMLGYEPNELPCTSAVWSELIHPEDKVEVFRAVDDYLNGKIS